MKTPDCPFICVSGTLYRFLLCGVVCVPLLCRPPELLAGASRRSSDLSLHISTQQDLNVIVRALCRKATDDELGQLRGISDRSIGLAAAWELARRALLESQRASTHSDATLRHFIRFAEQRLGTTAPAEWVDGILAAEVTSQHLIVFPPGNRTGSYHTVSLESVVDGRPLAIIGKLAPKGIQIIHDRDSAAVQFPSGKTIALTQKLANHLNADDQHLSVLESSDCACFALHNDLWHPYRVLRVGNQGTSIPWQCDVWAAGSSLTAGGSGFYHRVTMVQTTEELLVFGVSYISIYVEGFRVSDQRCTLRFGTFWGALDDR